MIIVSLFYMLVYPEIMQHQIGFHTSGELSPSATSRLHSWKGILLYVLGVYFYFLRMLTVKIQPPRALFRTLETPKMTFARRRREKNS